MRSKLSRLYGFQCLQAFTLKNFGLLSVTAVHLLDFLGVRHAGLPAFVLVPGQGPVPPAPAAGILGPGPWYAPSFLFSALLSVGVQGSQQRTIRPGEAELLETGIPAIRLSRLL